MMQKRIYFQKETEHRADSIPDLELRCRFGVERSKSWKKISPNLVSVHFILDDNLTSQRPQDLTAISQQYSHFHLPNSCM